MIMWKVRRCVRPIWQSLHATCTDDHMTYFASGAVDLDMLQTERARQRVYTPLHLHLISQSTTKQRLVSLIIDTRACHVSSVLSFSFYILRIVD